jgi:hypothetical protein
MPAATRLLVSGEAWVGNRLTDQIRAHHERRLRAARLGARLRPAARRLGSAGADGGIES